MIVRRQCVAIWGAELIKQNTAARTFPIGVRRWFGMKGVAQSFCAAEIVEVAAHLFEGRLWRFGVAEFEFGIFADVLLQAHVEIVLGSPHVFDDELVRFLIDEPQGIIAFGDFGDQFVDLGDAQIVSALHFE